MSLKRGRIFIAAKLKCKFRIDPVDPFIFIDDTINNYYGNEANEIDNW